MVNGQWSMVNGQWSMVNGQWSMVNGQWSMVNGQWYLLTYLTKTGEVSEWSKEHAWKVCILQKGIEGSNPSLSAECPGFAGVFCFHCECPEHIAFKQDYFTSQICNNLWTAGVNVTEAAQGLKSFIIKKNKIILLTLVYLICNVKTFRHFIPFSFLIVFTCIGRQSLYAQSLQGKGLADSLMHQFQKTKSDTAQVKLLIKAAKALTETDPPAAMIYVDSAMRISRRGKWKKGIGIAYINRALINRTTSNFAGGLENAAKAYEIFSSINWKPAMGQALSENASDYERLGNYTKAIEYNFKALRVYEDAGLDVNSAWIYNNIGIDYYQLNDYSKAIENYNKSLQYFKKINGKYGIASALDNIASVYEDEGQFSKVNEYNLQAIKLFEEIHDEPAMGRIYINRGNFLKDQNSIGSALIFYKKAIAIAQKLGIKSTLASGYGGIGGLYLNLAKNKNKKIAVPDSLKAGKTELLQKAHDYFSRAFELYKNIGELSFMMQFAQSLSETEALQGNYKNALNFYQHYTRYKDSIFNNDNKTKIASLENERITEVKDKEIQLLNKENALQAAEQEKKDTDAKRIKNIQYFTIIALGITVLSVVIIALLQYRNNRHRQKANMLLQQQKEKVESTLVELKLTQAQLIQSEKMASLGEITAGIAHEIQNPLNFVNNFSDVNQEMIDELEEELKSGNTGGALTIAAELEQNEQKINHHGKRADSIVKGMLQHSRVSSTAKEPTDINKVATEYLRVAYQGLRAKDKMFNADLLTHFDEHLPFVNIVPQDIGRVLLNLANNAFYAVQQRKKTSGSDYQPKVELSTALAGAFIEIRVKDNGNGISNDIKDKIMQPFFTTKPTGEGTGLGLSLSYDIVAKGHGGKLSATSEPGIYTEFIVALPV